MSSKVVGNQYIYNGPGYLDGKIQEELKTLLGEMYEPLMELRQTVKDGNRIQARMLEDIRVK